MRISDWSSDVCSSDLGYAHTIHAPAGAQKCELVDPALRPAVLDELARGRERLAALFGPRSLPVMVPPWNRIDAALAERLPGLGFAALSTYQASTKVNAAPGLVQTTCNLDNLRWKAERKSSGSGKSGYVRVELRGA